MRDPTLKHHRIVALALALCAASAAQAAIVNTSNPADIAAFESGATVETFDNISGITATPISDYNPKDLTGSTSLFTKDAAQPAFFNSGGATFNDPVGNPGVPVGIVSPTGGIGANKLSGNNVAGPIGIVTPPFTVFDAGAFMEVIFPTAVSKVGLYVASGSLQLILKDLNNSNLATGDASGTATAGNFLGLTRSSADVRGVTILGQGSFTIDDFTYSASSSTGDGSGGSGGGGSVPDSGNAVTLAAAGVFLWALSRKFKAQDAPV